MQYTILLTLQDLMGASMGTRSNTPLELNSTNSEGSNVPKCAQNLPDAGPLMALPDSGAQTEFGTLTNVGGLGIGRRRAHLRVWSNELKETGGASLFAKGSANCDPRHGWPGSPQSGNLSEDCG